MRTKNYLSLVLLLSIFSLTSCGNDIEPINKTCIDTNCANYKSQTEAQSDFNADPECRNDLDRDNDGVACEEPGNSVKDCSTTSNCGCSNKNKSPCQSDPCCQWIVGDGCKCS